MDFTGHHFACSVRTMTELFLLMIDKSAEELLPRFILLTTCTTCACRIFSSLEKKCRSLPEVPSNCHRLK